MVELESFRLEFGGWGGGREGGGIVNKQEAILISHAAVEELISLMWGSHTQKHTHAQALLRC